MRQRLSTPALRALVAALLTATACLASAAAPGPGAGGCAPPQVRAVQRAASVAKLPLSAACRRAADAPGETLVALIQPARVGNGHELIVAVVQRASNQVLALSRRPVEEDAAFVVGPDSLRIDTAAYGLAPGRRAFGVDLRGDYTANCGAGVIGSMRSLYLRQGAALREVLGDLVLETRTAVDGPGAGQRCGDAAAAAVDTELERRTIAVAATQTRGLRDLRITTTTTTTRTGGATATAERNMQRAVSTWQFDGTRYRAATPP